MFEFPFHQKRSIHGFWDGGLKFGGLMAGVHTALEVLQSLPHRTE